MRWGLVVALLLLVAAGCDDRRRPRTERAATAPPTAMVRAAAACVEAAVGDAAAAAVCRDACELGHSNSCARFAEHLGLVLQHADALVWAARGCEGGSGTGCDAAARLAGEPARVADFERRARIYHRVHCEQGYRPSCEGLAQMYRDGRGGPVDEAVAAHFDELARRAAE